MEVFLGGIFDIFSHCFFFLFSKKKELHGMKGGMMTCLVEETEVTHVLVGLLGRGL